METPMNTTKLKVWANANRDLAMTVLKAKCFAELERKRVDAYIEPLFQSWGFTDDEGAPITESKYLYKSEDEKRCKAFYVECARAHREHGWRGEDDHCPALVAEDLQTRAESLLLEELAKFMGVSGFYSLELRARALDLALGACFAK